MSTENNSESNSKRSRHEMESSESPDSSSSYSSSSLLIGFDENHVFDTNQNVLRPLSEQNGNSDNENSTKLSEMMIEMRTIRSQIQTLTERLDDIQFERGAADKTNFDSSITAGVDFSELALVLETVNDVNQFESKLKSKDFKMTVLNSLLRIGGTTGTMDATKVVRTVFSTLFDDELKKKYTWTGHGGRAAFKDLHEIRKLIFEVVVQADRKYSLMQFDYDIIHKLLKVKRPSTGRAPLNLSQTNHNVFANSQTLNGLSGASDSICRTVNSTAMTPTRFLNRNVDVSDAWSYMMASVFPQVN